jgi:tRNA(Leu) C34 or U34 (ribose-2'-O)-methylase TrmL
MKPVQIESTLAKIANLVFETRDFKAAQKAALDHLSESKIKESDRLKIIEEISNKKNLIALQTYVANALLRYEGLGIGKSTSSIAKNETQIENSEL